MKPSRFDAEQVRAKLADTDCESALAFAEPLSEFLNLLAKWNQVYNLTGFKDAQRLLDRNLLECLSIRDWLAGAELADVGTGAGLPGLPLAITEPQRRFTLIESRAKRVRFLRHVVGELGLDNVIVQHSRAEHLPKGACFDTVLARAVAAPQQLITIVRGLMRAGSRLILLTSPETGEAYRNTPEDFALRQIAPAGERGRYGVIVHLERTA